jgi:hypothetical protein
MSRDTAVLQLAQSHIRLLRRKLPVLPKGNVCSDSGLLAWHFQVQRQPHIQRQQGPWSHLAPGHDCVQSTAEISKRRHHSVDTAELWPLIWKLFFLFGVRESLINSTDSEACGGVRIYSRHIKICKLIALHYNGGPARDPPGGPWVCVILGQSLPSLNLYFLHENNIHLGQSQRCLVINWDHTCKIALKTTAK